MNFIKLIKGWFIWMIIALFVLIIIQTMALIEIYNLKYDIKNCKNCNSGSILQMVTTIDINKATKIPHDLPSEIPKKDVETDLL